MQLRCFGATGDETDLILMWLVEIAFFAGIDPAGGAGEVDVKNLYIGRASKTDKVYFFVGRAGKFCKKPSAVVSASRASKTNFVHFEVGRAYVVYHKYFYVCRAGEGYFEYFLGIGLCAKCKTCERCQGTSE